MVRHQGYQYNCHVFWHQSYKFIFFPCNFIELAVLQFSNKFNLIYKVSYLHVYVAKCMKFDLNGKTLNQFN